MSWGTNTAKSGFQQNYVGLKNFFSDIDFEQDYYKVNVSNYDFLSREAGTGHNDNKFEFFAMTNFDETKAFGWVHNRSNYISTVHHGELYDTIKSKIPPYQDSLYLYVTCPDDDNSNEEDIDDDVNLNCSDGVQSRDADDQKIKLRGFNQGRYRIEWFNTNTGSYISSQYENALFDGALWGLEIKIPFAIGPNLINDFAFKAYYDPQNGERLSSSNNNSERIEVNSDTNSNLQNGLYEVSVFPNPTTNEINIQSNKLISRIEIYNNLSMKVYDNSKYSENNIKLGLESLSSGTYFIKIWSNVHEIKIIKTTKL